MAADVRGSTLPIDHHRVRPRPGKGGGDLTLTVATSRQAQRADDIVLQRVGELGKNSAFAVRSLAIGQRTGTRLIIP